MVPTNKTDLTGPSVYVVFPKRKGKIHLTGGYQASSFDHGLCQRQLTIDEVVDARDIAPYSEFTGEENYDKWCGQCLHRLNWEALDQQILFAFLPTDDFALYRNQKKPGRYVNGMRIGEYFDNRRVGGRTPPPIPEAPNPMTWRRHKVEDLPRK